MSNAFHPESDSMSNFLFRTLMLMFVLLCSACSGDYPKPDKNASAASVYNFYQRTDNSHWIKSRISYINHFHTGSLFADSDKVSVYPGRHFLVVLTELNQGYDKKQGVLHAKNKLSFKARAHSEYRIVGKPLLNKMAIWIENSRGEKVSKVSISELNALKNLPLSTRFPAMKN